MGCESDQGCLAHEIINAACDRDFASQGKAILTRRIIELIEDLLLAFRKSDRFRRSRSRSSQQISSKTFFQVGHVIRSPTARLLVSLVPASHQIIDNWLRSALRIGKVAEQATGDGAGQVAIPGYMLADGW